MMKIDLLPRSDDNPRNSEGSMVESSDGSLLFACTRFCGGPNDNSPAVIAARRSFDSGETWTPPFPSPLVSPLSPASIKTLPGSETLIAVYNDHSGSQIDYSGFPFQNRTPLNARISRDGGKLNKPFCYRRRSGRKVLLHLYSFLGW